MYRKNQKGAVPIGILLLIIIFGIALDYPIMTFLILSGIAVLYYLAVQPEYCDCCRTQLKRKSYSWILQGESKKVCPNCNRSLERKISRAAIGNFV